MAGPSASRPFRLPAEALARLAETDFARPGPFLLLAAVFLAVRVPFLDHGYGTDPDAWRVAVAARYLIDHGDYFPSRLPGNPLHELAMAPLVPLGWVATNLATALAALVGVWLFARIGRELSLPHAGLATVVFAFAPLLLINSVATMDYVWALTALLGAYLAALRGAPVLAGACLGLAMGFRLASFVAWLPLALVLWRRGEPLRLLPLSGAAGGVLVLAFAPVLVSYGPAFLNFYDAAVEFEVVLRLLGKEALGVIGGLGVLIGLALTLPRFRSLPADAIRDPHVGVWLLAIAAFFASFFRLPHEVAYLLPVFPFGLYFLARYMSRAVFAFVAVAVLLPGLVDITTPGEGIRPADIKTARVGKGLLLSNVDTMRAQRAFVQDILANQVPDHSVVLAGFVYPQLAMRARDRLEMGILQRDYGAISLLSDRGEAVDRERDVRYVWLLTYEAFEALRSQGYSFFLVPDAAGGTSALFDFRPTLLGATFLDLERLAPAAGKVTASTDR
jgi:hypothetical protein